MIALQSVILPKFVIISTCNNDYNILTQICNYDFQIQKGLLGVFNCIP